MLVGSVDFFGLNHYSSHLCEQPSWYKELAPQEEEDERDSKLVRGRPRERQPLLAACAHEARHDAADGTVLLHSSTSRSTVACTCCLTRAPAPPRPACRARDRSKSWARSWSASSAT